LHNRFGNCVVFVVIDLDEPKMSALMSPYVTSIYMTARELSFSSRPRIFARTESTF
jgi:hypothetical protein